MGWSLTKFAIEYVERHNYNKKTKSIYRKVDGKDKLYNVGVNKNEMP